MPETPDNICNLKISGTSMMTVVIHSDAWSNCTQNTDYHASSQNSFSGQTHFSFHGHHLSFLLA